MTQAVTPVWVPCLELPLPASLFWIQNAEQHSAPGITGTIMRQPIPPVWIPCLEYHIRPVSLLDPEHRTTFSTWNYRDHHETAGTCSLGTMPREPHLASLFWIWTAEEHSTLGITETIMRQPALPVWVPSLEYHIRPVSFGSGTQKNIQHLELLGPS
ncbi:hypothetical protein NDU88_013198 [Pleurodeles waltl]|uniref:Uncharacterized protein n=1 Tax=Pleurodeles waltl TaxID=8319 RepID=A0AAV7R2C8_PLEWA|nr:hypothetical protein NDU88_013198 [Pleurodeles waltl]